LVFWLAGAKVIGLESASEFRVRVRIMMRVKVRVRVSM
jgi:hypothetical protein